MPSLKKLRKQKRKVQRAKEKARESKSKIPKTFEGLKAEAGRYIRKLTGKKRSLDKKIERKLEEKAASKPNFNGHPDNVNADVKKLIAIANHQFGLVVTSTTDYDTHSASSYHYPRNNPDNLGGAVDLAGSRDQMVRFQRYCYDRAGKFKESIGPDNNMMVKNGARYSLPEGNPLENSHDNHNHVAPYPGSF